LSEIFEKADLSGDGSISIYEYVAVCETYGIALTQEDLEGVKSIADSEGEVPVMGGAYQELPCRSGRAISSGISRRRT
jgi:hypothetical protein